MQLIQQSEGTAAQRRIFFTMVDSVDLHTRKTGITVAVRITKNGAATAAGGGSAPTQVDSTNFPGLYYYEATSGELDTVGIFAIYCTGTGCEPREVAVQVVPWDPYDSARLGMTDPIPDDGITAAKIAANAIGASEIADGAIDAAAIATGAITSTKFAAGAIDAAAIAADAIGASELAADAVTEIQSGLATAASLTTVATQIARALGLVHENAMVDNTVHSAGKLTSARVRVFANAAALASAVAGHADGADSEVYRYTITTTYSGADLATHKIAKAL